MEGYSAKKDVEFLKKIGKEEFLQMVLQGVEIWGCDGSRYKFGDVGPIYGTQWRSYGQNGHTGGIDQIQDIIATLKKNPDDRRMMCIAYNPSQTSRMALPPCHVMFQFYTRKLSNDERMEIFNERYDNGCLDGAMPHNGKQYDVANIPKYGLSCMYTMRSNDLILGQPFNAASYAILTHMIAKLVNMVPDELIGSIGDCHIYSDHIFAVENGLLNRNGSSKTPTLAIIGKQKSIDDFKFEDFVIEDYEPEEPIKYNLSVGL